MGEVVGLDSDKGEKDEEGDEWCANLHTAACLRLERRNIHKGVGMEEHLGEQD